VMTGPDVGVVAAAIYIRAIDGARRTVSYSAVRLTVSVAVTVSVWVDFRSVGV
jgi:hypothetical protein